MKIRKFVKYVILSLRDNPSKWELSRRDIRNDSSTFGMAYKNPSREPYINQTIMADKKSVITISGLKLNTEEEKLINPILNKVILCRGNETNNYQKLQKIKTQQRIIKNLTTK